MNPPDVSVSRHPRGTEPPVLLFTLVLAVAGAVVGMEIVTRLGVTPNTSIVGVILAILVSRIPLRAFRTFRSIHRQNLVQTTVSSATFGAANSLLVPVGVPVLLGRPELVLPMLVGATAGMLIDLAMLYWLFDSRLFPGSGPWPVGIASAEAILAGDEGGRRARLLGAGAAAGILGSSGLFGALRATTGVAALPMAAFGIAFLGNPWALAMFGLGLLARGYGPAVAAWDLEALLVPHGMMIGAGVVAFGQVIAMVVRDGSGRHTAPVVRDQALDEAAGAMGGRAADRTDREGAGGMRTRGHREDPVREQNAFAAASLTRSESAARAGLLRGVGLYLAAGLVLAMLGGLWTQMPAPQLAGWAAFAAFACVAAELIVGLSAMQAGWFPAFATALVFLMVSLILRFPPEAAALLVGFVASGGPAFADAGYDLKTGWILRGFGRDRAFEMDGRRQQVLAALVGLLTALVMVTAFHRRYFDAGLFPPVVRVYGAAIGAGIDPDAVTRVALWAIPGAALQLAGGASRQLGILLATGLLIVNPLAGWAVLLALAIRIAWTRKERAAAGPGAKAGEAGTGPGASPMTVTAGGIIAGDALWGFGSALLR